MSGNFNGTCYICDRKLNGRGQGDHFPVSKCNGGDNVIPICKLCHDDKDRISFGNWDSSILGSIVSLWEKLDRDERLFFAKMIHIMNMQQNTIKALSTNRK